ncbi:MAG: DUF3164 family protein [Bacteroidales bacterium]|uniref:DUF3164 family protein n=1 Tax=Porphyromonas sp. TaxID=1924944 RepID=UPI002979B94B|nr:DUF3164 family protein [Porphyromonas sp.]MDD7438596.1 DUF3164 family protein [Bacteroidales bacterium]MDY3067852.1 DUF3164 family protein [Porphyromonas sp.]
METKSVQMTEEEYQEYLAMKKKREAEVAKERRRSELEAYRALVDTTLVDVADILREKSQDLTKTKAYVMGLFREVIEMKQEVIGIKEGGQYSHTFTSSDSTVRITVGYHTVDGYLDTVNEGIAMVREYIESLGSDDNSKALVQMILQLLSTDQQGNLKASRVVQLRKYANESGDARFVEGVELIESAYMPQKTRQYIRLDVKDEESNAWRAIPLSMTDVDSNNIVREEEQ